MILDFLSGARAQLRRYYGVIANAWTWSSSAEVITQPTEFIDFYAQAPDLSFEGHSVNVSFTTAASSLDWVAEAPRVSFAGPAPAVEFSGG